MSQQDILRKYLDILSDAAPAESKEEFAQLEQISAPSSNPVKDLLEAIAKFKASQSDLDKDSRLDPKTLARIMSLSKLAENDMPSNPMPTDNPMPDTPMPENPMPTANTTMDENIMDTLRKKAALHRGYSHGLLGDSHTHCGHKEGSHEHMHWHHGYSTGLKECSGVWGPGSM